jgi:hypothetical protein
VTAVHWKFPNPLICMGLWENDVGQKKEVGCHQVQSKVDWTMYQICPSWLLFFSFLFDLQVCWWMFWGAGNWTERIGHCQTWLEFTVKGYWKLLLGSNIVWQVYPSCQLFIKIYMVSHAFMLYYFLMMSV